jgi:L-threonylcarbamoyladenylate synthase
VRRAVFGRVGQYDWSVNFDPANPDQPDAPSGPSIADAVERLRAGGLVAFPTETVYGLGADALNAQAVSRVFAAKGRPAHNPLIVHVTGQEMAQSVLAPGAWDDRAAKLARAFWPGPLTIVLPKAANVPDNVSAGGATVGVRCPDHPLALSLLFEFGRPMVGPSANKSGHVSPTRASHVRESFDEREVMVLDGGICETGIESTVVLLGERVRVLRPGVIGAEAIARVLGVHVEAATGARDKASASSNGVAGEHHAAPLLSPGLLDSHYAPRAKCVVFDGREFDEVLEELVDLTDDHAGDDRSRVVLITHALREVPEPLHMIDLPPDAPGYAQQLYAALRTADAMNPALIVVEHPPMDNGVPEHTPIWAAIRDRLSRATTAW